jgi:hypothetical protein
VTSQPPRSSSDDEPPDDPDATREIPRPVRSAWSRGYEGPPTQTYDPPPAPEPRFAGQPYTSARPPADYPPPGGPYDPGEHGQPWHSPDAGFPPPIGGWPAAPPPPGGRHRGRLVLVTLLVLAMVGALTSVVLTTSDSKTTAGRAPTAPSGAAIPGPSTAPTPSPSSPSSPLPSIGLVPTPPGLSAIGYHAYSLGLVAPADIALGPAEVLQFKQYHLERVVGLRAFTLGRTDSFTDDYDASINVLRFRDAAGAKAELAYSNRVNAETSQVIGLPGLPDATGFVNKDSSSNGVGVGAFTTVGRYQVVVIVSGLSSNRPTSAAVVAAEAARVMRAVLPDAAGIQPVPSSGGGSGIPALPTPGPSGIRA